MNKRYALCVGINDYPGSNADLSGCVNDAHDWAALLMREGYDVRIMVDGQATKAALIDALKEIVAKTGYGDRMVFQYSGHGTWLPDRDGDEADQRDEALVCHDYANNGLLVDDELNAILSTRYGSRSLVLSDSCFSGTLLRFLPQVKDAKAKPRFLPPSAFSDLSPQQARAIEERTTTKTLSRTGPVLISGSSDLEYSYDATFAGRGNGAFSRAALDTYAPGVTVRKWYEAIRATLPNVNHPQTPQLTAKTSQMRRSAL